MNPKPLKLYICLLYILIILFWGLRPFNFRPVNGVEWLDNENGISFQDLGIVCCPSGFSNSHQPFLSGKNESISIELWLKAGSNDRRAFSNIFCLYDDNQSEIFSFSQARSSLNISKYQKPGKKGLSYSWRWLGKVFFKGQKRFLTITSDKRSTTVYLDGRKVVTYRNYSLILSKKHPSASRIVIGNNPSGTQPWTGEIYGLAIYNRALAPERVNANFEKWRNESALSLLEEKDIIALYPMNEKSGQLIHNAASNHYHLSIPDKFKILKKSYLKLSGNALELNGSSLRDMRINILGFIPLGYLLIVTIYTNKFSWSSSWRLIFLVIFGGTVVSLFIEILQAYLPTRNSSLSDLIFNTFGTALGVTLAWVYIKTKKSCLKDTAI